MVDENVTRSKINSVLFEVLPPGTTMGKLQEIGQEVLQIVQKEWSPPVAKEPDGKNPTP